MDVSSPSWRIPTTTRGRVLALAALASVVVLVLVVLVVTGRGGPPTIVLASSGPAAAESAVADDADVARLHAVNFEFELAEGARFPAGEATAWGLEPPADLRSAAAALAEGLGVGTPTATPEGGFTAGGDGDGPTLWISPSGEWSFSDHAAVEPLDCVVEPVEPGEPVPVEPDEGAGESGSSGTGEAGSSGAGKEGSPGVGEDTEVSDEDGPDRVVREPGPCPEPTPPADVPDADEARRLAEGLFTDLGGAAPTFTEVHADEWGAWANGSVPVDGRATDLPVSAGFGGGGALVAANGTLARPVEVADYPTVDAQAAVERLGAGGGFAVATTTVEEPEVVEDGRAADEPVSSPDDPVSDEGNTPAPGPDAEPETTVVRLVAAEEILVTQYGTDGTVWLLPGVRFTDDDGGVWQAVTVAEGFIEFADPEPLPEPPPAEPEPAPAPEPPPADVGGDGSDGAAPVAPEVEALAEEVVGLSEAEAVDHIDAAGGVARVVHRDGEDLPVTDDLRNDRVNLHIEDGVVVRTTVG